MVMEKNQAFIKVKMVELLEISYNKESGFPANEGVGRIGLAMFNENVIYAVLDNQNKRPKQFKNKLTTMLSSPGADIMEISNKELNNALKESGFRDKYRAENIKIGLLITYGT